MKAISCPRPVIAVFALLTCCGSISAQTGPLVAGDQLARSRADLIGATQEYRDSTEKLLRMEEEEFKRSAERLEQLRQIFAEGIIAKSELAESEQTLLAARLRLEERRQQIADSDRLVVEIKAAEGLAKSQPPPSMPGQTPPVQAGSYSQTGVIIRYTGKAYWSLASLSTVQSFFSSRFGHALPISAFGQTATHNQLGFNHRNAVDVALHPDSEQGRALISYLQSQGITFIAFRAAVPGAATGPHIHIGAASHRLA